MKWEKFIHLMEDVDVPFKNNKFKRGLKLAEELLEFECAISPICRTSELEDVCITLALSIRVNGAIGKEGCSKGVSFTDCALALVQAFTKSHANRIKQVNFIVLEKILAFKGINDILESAWCKVKPDKDYEQVELFDEED